MSFYTGFDWLTNLRLFSYILNLKTEVVLKESRAVVIMRFSLNEAPLGLFKFIFDYFPYFEKINIFFNSIASCGTVSLMVVGQFSNIWGP